MESTLETKIGSVKHSLIIEKSSRIIDYSVLYTVVVGQNSKC